MDFTATYRHSARECIAFSPGSTFIAYVGGTRGNHVLVRVTGTLQVVRSWDLDQPLQSLSWSRDGLFLLVSAHAARKEQGVSYVLPLDPDASVADGSDDGQGWVAKLDAGPPGLHSASWLPVWRIPAVVQFSQFGIRAVVNSLVDQALFVVPHAHPICVYILTVLASAAWPEHYGMVQRVNECDYIVLFRAANAHAPNLDAPVEWVRDRAIRLHTRNISDVLWSPDGNYLCAWEQPLEYKLYVHALSGAHLATFQQVNGATETVVAHGALAGRSSLRSSQSNPISSGTLGIRKVAWHPSSQFLAIGGFDEAVRILASTDWMEAYTFDLSGRIVRATVWTEPRHWFEATGGCSIVNCVYTRLPVEQVASPVELHAAANDLNEMPRVGISELSWNADGSFLAVVNEAVPTAVFIFSFNLGEGIFLTAVLHLSTPVCTLAWSPKGDSLAVACSTSAVYIWNEVSPEAVAVPNSTLPLTDGFTTQRVEWSQDGRALLLVAPSAFCCAISSDQDTP